MSGGRRSRRIGDVSRPGRLAVHAARRQALAAVVHQEVEQVLSTPIVGGVDDLALPTLGLDEARPLQLLQVEGERGGRNAEMLCDLTGRKSRWTLPHEEAEDRETRLLAERRQRDQGLILFHHSKIIEIINHGKR